MSNNEIHADNNICEATGCSAKATNKIDVKVGQRGTIGLHLCVNCIHKFDEKEKMLERVEEPLSNTNQNTQPLSLQGVTHREND
jgi:hypothetical protein